MPPERPLSTDTTLARLLDIVVQISGPSRVPPDPEASTPLWGGGFWLDSIDLLDLMLACDAAFGPVFASAPRSVMAGIKTVGDLVAIIEARPRTLDSKSDASMPAAHHLIREHGRPGREDSS